MRVLRFIACLLCGLASVARADDVLKFRNGDRLQGALLSANATGLRWQTAAAPQPIQFDSTQLGEVQLGPRAPKTSRQLHGLLVELTNGDKLTGDIVALDDQSLTLETWYAGNLPLKRTLVKRLESRTAVAAVVYAGPTGLKDWRVGQTGWSFNGGRFYCQRGRYTTIGKNVELPDVASLEFDVAWRGQPYWSVGFYGGDIPGQGGYLLACNGHYLQLNRTVAGNQRNFGSNVQVPQFRTRNMSRLAIRVNKPKKTIAVFVDNVLVQQWSEPEEFAGNGRAIFFQSQGQAELRLANILVTEWDGKLDAETPAPRAGADDLVFLANGDKVSGRLRAITGGVAMLTNSFAEVKIPLTKITTIDFASQTAETARRQEHDVRAFFPDGAQFTVALDQLDEQQGLTGVTESCGRVLLPLDTFTRLQFRVYEKSVASDPDDDWGVPPTGETNPRRAPSKRSD